MARQGRCRRAAVLAAACATTGLLVPPAAQAATPGPTVSLGKSHGLEYVRAKIKDVVSQAGAPANCDAGDSATGGGGFISGAGINASLSATYPTSLAGAGWQGEGHTLGASGRTVTSYAICGADEVTYTTHDTVIGQNGALLTSEGPCNVGSHVTGGGVRAQGGNVVIARSLPDSAQSGWDILVFNPLNSSSSTVSPFAGCSDAYELRYRQEAGQVKPATIGKVVARCKGREAVTGGGFKYVGPYEAWDLATRPWDSRADNGKTPDDGWSASFYNSLEDAPVDVTAFAVCKR
jgi:hypothetical protein